MRGSRRTPVAFVVTPVLLLAAGLLLGLAGVGCGRQAGSSQATPAATPVQTTPVVTLPPAVPSMINDVSPAGLDAYIEAKMKVAHVPGLAACVVHDGEVVWAKGFGWANITRRRRVTAGRRG